MSGSSPIRLAVLAALLLALTMVTARSLRSDGGGQPERTPGQVVQITVPVEIIETGEDPAVLEVEVPR